MSVDSPLSCSTQRFGAPVEYDEPLCRYALPLIFLLQLVPSGTHSNQAFVPNKALTMLVWSSTLLNPVDNSPCPSSLMTGAAEAAFDHCHFSEPFSLSALANCSLVSLTSFLFLFPISKH